MILTTPTQISTVMGVGLTVEENTDVITTINMSEVDTSARAMVLANAVGARLLEWAMVVVVETSRVGPILPSHSTTKLTTTPHIGSSTEMRHLQRSRERRQSRKLMLL